MLKRFLIFLTSLLLGSLVVEVAMYHNPVATESDGWAVLPGVAGALGMAGGFLTLARTTPLTTRLFATSCALSMLVGLIGTAFHLAMHGPSLTTLLVDPAAWLGNPPTLAPLAFSVGGLLGISAIRPGDVQAVPRAPIGGICYVLACLSGLIAASAYAGHALSITFVATIAALALAAFSFVAEFVADLAAARVMVRRGM
jgi:hypothetical protein